MLAAMAATLPVRFAARTDVGRKRDHNEDNFLVDPKLSLFVVCDGMGGHAAGEEASRYAIHSLRNCIGENTERLDRYLKLGTKATHADRQEILHLLEAGINQASAAVNGEANRSPEKRGMGTTLVSALLIGREAFIAHVGDSRLYLFRDGSISQVTEDHSVENDLIRKKKLNPEQVGRIKNRRAITRAVGVYAYAEADTMVLEMLAGDRLLLCSDGLSNYFDKDPDELGQELAGPGEEDCVQRLIDVANARGGKDNITVVLISVGDAESRDEVRAKRLTLKREVLKNVPLFKVLKDRERMRLVQRFDVLTCEAGNAVMQQGEDGKELVIVLSGKLEVLRDGGRVATLEAGQHAGEMSLVRSQPRSATVRALERSELLVMSRKQFYSLVRDEPELAVKLLWQLSGSLADRLAETTRELGAVKAQNQAERKATDQKVNKDASQETSQQMGEPDLAAEVADRVSRPPPPPPTRG